MTFNNPVSVNYTLTGTAGNGITGAAGITKTGDGSLTLGGDNTFTGGLVINKGMVNVGSATGMGADGGQITVNAGGQLNYNGISLAPSGRSYSLTIAGDGADGFGDGAIVNNNAVLNENSRILNLTLSDHATIGAFDGTLPTGNRLDIGYNGSVFGSITGNGKTLTKVGDAMLNMRAAATDISYIVSAGTLRAENNSLALGSTGVTVNSYATLDSYGALTFGVPVTFQDASFLTSSNNTATWAGLLTLQGDVNLGGAGSMNIAQPFAETASGLITKSGTGTVVLPAANTFNRKFDVTGTGILRIPTDDALGTVPGTDLADAITLESGGKIQGGNNTTGVNLTLDAKRGITLANGDGGFHVWTGFTLDYAGTITGPGNLTKSDGGTVNYTGVANHNGATSISAGTANFNMAAILSTSGLNATGGVTNINPGTIISTTGATNLQSATLNINGGQLTTGRFITDNGSNTSTTVNHTSGSVTITGTDNTNSNTASFLMGHWPTGNTSIYNLSGGILNSTGANLSLGWDSANTLFNQSGGTANLLGLNLGNSRNNMAVYNLNGGRLNLGVNGISTNANKVVNLGSGTLGASDNWSSAQPMDMTGTVTPVVVNTLDSDDNISPLTITLTGVLSGGGGLSKAENGVLILGGANTYSGPTTANGGTLRIQNSLRNSALFTVNSGALMQTAATNIFVFDHSTAVAASRVITIDGGTWVMESGDTRIGNVTLNNGATWTSSVNTAYGVLLANNSVGASTVTVGGSGASLMDGAGGLRLQGIQKFNVAKVAAPEATDLTVTMKLQTEGSAGGTAGGIEKTGLGTMALEAVNEYTGTTTVSGGKLLVNGSVVGGAIVGASGTLGGTGTVTGASTVNGTVAPGNSVGTLNFGSTLDLASGSTYAVEITGAGTNDKINVTGSLTANGVVAVALDGYVPVLGNAFDIADAASISGAPSFDFSAAPLAIGLAWDTSAFAATGVIMVTTADAYGAWATLHGVTGGKGGDDDNDNVSNLLEFATNADPKSGGSLARAYGKMHVLGADNALTYTIATRKSAVFAASGATQQATKDNVLYTVQGSNELGGWTTVVVTELSPVDAAAVRAAIVPPLPTLESDWEWHSFRTDGGAAGDPTDFIRLQINSAP